MANKRANAFRERGSKKAAALNVQEAAERQMDTLKLVLGLSQRVFEMEKRLNLLFPLARKTNWRLSGLIKLMEGNVLPNVTFQKILDEAEKIQIADFDRSVAEADAANNLLEFTGPAKHGDYAIVELKLFNGEVELIEERVVRIKIRIGESKLFKELDVALLEMTPGQSKMFGISIPGKADMAEVILHGLRRKVQNEEIQKEQ